jgi:hypothetical protein
LKPQRRQSQRNSRRWKNTQEKSSVEEFDEEVAKLAEELEEVSAKEGAIAQWGTLTIQRAESVSVATTS